MGADCVWKSRIEAHGRVLSDCGVNGRAQSILVL